MGSERTGILLVIEGWGHAPEDRYNAVSQARTPNLDRLFGEYPHFLLEASGKATGLPEGVPSTSEAGYLTLGAGRPLAHARSLIQDAIQSGSFFENPALLDISKRMHQQQRGTLHLIGLFSDADVHSEKAHLFALLQFAKREKIRQVALHLFLDGRDAPSVRGLGLIEELRAFCDDVGVGRVETIMGRYFAMDRDLRWDRTRLAYEAIVAGTAESVFVQPAQYVESCYDKGLVDEFIAPAVREEYPGIKDGDGVVFFNFRGDRARQLAASMTDPEFSHFRRANLPTFCGFVTLADYGLEHKIVAAYATEKPDQTLAKVLSENGVSQLRVAETEAFTRISDIFDGSSDLEHEMRLCVPGEIRTESFDQQPTMAAAVVTKTLLEKLGSGSFQFAVAAYPNLDLVAHTGNFPATVRAMECLDAQIGDVLRWADSHDAFVVVAANHGNAESLRQGTTGLLDLTHTLSPALCAVFDKRYRGAREGKGR